MTQPTPPTSNCVLNTIIGFLLPFFLAGADGNADVAKAAIRELIDSYNPRTRDELDLVGRIIGFSIVGMDNLRLSMTPGMSDTKVLRYRGNAITLSRSSDQARKILDTLKSGQEVKQDVPRPAVAAAPKPVSPAPFIDFPIGMEAMKREARTMLAAFSKGTPAPFAIPAPQDTASMVKAAVRVAVGGAQRPPPHDTGARQTAR